MKPSIPKGTRDFSPVEMNRRNYIFDTIKKVFQRYGYQQIETPSMENLETLTGKYGDEGDKLLFKILNSGDFTSSAKVRKHVLKDLAENNSSKLDLVVGEHYPLRFIATPNELLNEISEKGLRYDLTVPFARYVVMHQHEITFPFKRYQIQPVWRADRPQKGRYREFYQCDVDVIGSDSLLNEVELIQIIDEVFTKLGMEVTIKINNRKVLYAIADIIGHKDQATEFAIIMDKLDKINWEGVIKELAVIGIDGNKVFNLFSPTHNVSGYINIVSKFVMNEFGLSVNEANECVERVNINFKQFIHYLASFLNSNMLNDNTNTEFNKGIKELFTVYNYLSLGNLESTVIEFDPYLARGLNYYTGAIIEVKANNVSMGSICGGGRYDDLTGIFGLPNVSGVGISFGADRIYDVLNELGKFPDFISDSTQVLIYNYVSNDQKIYLDFVSKIRAAGINAELFPDAADKGNANKLQKKQFEYVKAKNIPFTIVIEDSNKQEAIVKSMITKGTNTLKFESFIEDLLLFIDSNK